MEKTSYTAENITIIKDLPTARSTFDFEILKNKIHRRGDLTKLSRELNINRYILDRGLKECRILSIFPGIEKSKAAPLSTIKFDRELGCFAKQYKLRTLKVRELWKAVKNWRNNLEKNPRILLNKLQYDLIIGSLIGDSSIRQRNKNCNFRVGHTKKQEKYLLWKYKILREFTLSKPRWSIRHLRANPIETLELATFTHSVFNHYRKLFYQKGTKRINRKILDRLNDRSLAIWVCDDGSYDNKQGYIVLCTNSYNLKEHKIMKSYFNEVWNLDPTIGFRDKKYYYLRFKQEDSKRLISIIKPFILRGMEYKIGGKNAQR